MTDPAATGGSNPTTEPPTGTPPARPARSGWRRWLTLRRILLVTLGVPLLALVISGVWLYSVATSTWEADLLGLVPADMAVVLELRDIPDRKRQIIAFAEALFNDPAWQEAAGSRTIRELLGGVIPTDSRGRLERPDRWLTRQLAEVRATSIPVGDAILGGLDPEEDFLGAEVIVSIRPGGDADGKRTDEGYLPVSGLLQVRVSPRIRVYHALAGLAPTGDSLKLTARDGYTAVTVIDDAGTAATPVWFAMHGDVLSVATSESLIRSVVALANGDGHALGDHAEWQQAREAIDRTAGSTASVEADSSSGRIYADIDALRTVVPVDELVEALIGGDSMRRTPAGQQFAGLIEPAANRVLHTPSLHTLAARLRLADDIATGPTVTLETALRWHADRMPAGLRDTLTRGGVESALLDLGGKRTFVGASLATDLDAVTDEIGGLLGDADRVVVVDVLDGLTDVALVGDELLFIAAGQDQAGRQPGDGTQPATLVGLRLTEQGADLARHDAQALSELVLTLLAGDDAEHAQVIPDTVSGELIYRFFAPDNPDNPDIGPANNLFAILLRSTFGPQTDPAVAPLLPDDPGQHNADAPGYLLIAAHADLLADCLVAWRTQRSRFRRPTGVMGAHFADRAIASLLIDVREYLTQAASPEMIRTAAEHTWWQTTPPPSVREGLRARAEREAGGPGPRADRRYDELAAEWVAMHVERKRNRAVASALDVRRVLRLVRRVGLQLSAIDSATAHLHAVITFGSARVTN